MNKEIPKFSLERLDYSELQESSKDNSPGPFQFGKAHEVKLDLSNGKWYEEDGNNIWTLTITSSGAYSINLIFDELYLPEGYELFLLNIEKNIVMGPIDSSNSQSSEEFWTDLIPGDEVTLKLIEPQNMEGKTRLSISKIIHGFINTYSTTGFGASSDCNIDIDCPQGQPFQAESNAIARLLVNDGQSFCSGAMINNACNDYTPNLLTADHCMMGSINNFVFRFQYRSPSPRCDGSGGGGNTYVNIFYNGAVLRARRDNTVSDYALLELNTRPTHTNLSFLGWSRNTTGITNTACLHHPNGDLMKISIDNQSPTANGNYWYSTFDIGTVEHGSSGAPLLDQNRRIIGQLHSGNCLPSPKNVCYCDNRLGTYGRFDVSWDNGLSAWLTNDPNVMTTNTIAIPYFTMSGSDFVICSSPAIGINMINAPSQATHNVTWTVTPNLTIISQGHSSVLVRYSGTQNGAATITANIGNNNPGTCPVVTPFTFNVQAGPFAAGQVIVSGQPAVCPSYEYTYTANPYGGHRAGYTYSWTYPSGWYVVYQSANTIRLRVPQYNPNYGTVRAAVNNGCGISGYSGLTVYPGYGCGGYSYAWYPNPAEDELKVEVVSDADGKNLSQGSAVISFETYIYDKSGNLVKFKKSNDNQSYIDLSDLKRGHYLLNIIDANKSIQEHLLIE